MQTIRRWTSLAALFAALSLAIANEGAGQSPLSTKEPELIAILQGEAPAADKALACKSLAIYGSSAAVPELAKLLPDPQLASWARIALEAIPGQAADESLRKAAETLEGNLLIGVINSIGVRRDAAAVELLTAQLKHQNPEIGVAAAVALGHIGNEAAAKSLRAALSAESAALRAGAAEGCILCAERFLADGHDADATQLYDEVRQADVPRPRKHEATRGAILARGQDGIPLLIELLSSSDVAQVRLALGTAREFPGSEIDKALAAALDRLEPDRAALVIAAMVDRPKTADLSAVMKAAARGAKPVRLAALAALGRIGTPDSLSLLLAAALESDADIAPTAQAALAELPGEEVDKEIVARLPNAQGPTARLLIELVGQRRIQATSHLVKALDQSDKAIRTAALASLGSTVTPKTLSVLIAQVTAPKHADDLPVAVEALKTAATRMPDREACAMELSQALGRASAPTKDSLLEILSEVGGTKALQTIGAAAKSNDPQLQDTGSRLLGKWSSVDAAPVLLDLAKTAPSDRYHVRAVRGYISLARRFATMPESQRLEICQNALDVARNTADKKLVLDVLALYPTLESLKMAAKAAQIPELKADAVQAALLIASKAKEEPGRVEPLLTNLGLTRVKLEIVKAEYGSGTTQMDVTEILRTHARDVQLISLPSSYNTAFGGDPAPGDVKQLRIQYRLNGKDGQATFRENALIVLLVP
uniref:PBS lyase n=1 Tax=Schlesneria paludicola TaxID=360056 RepID=A0A7C2NX10_9PLAN